MIHQTIWRLSLCIALLVAALAPVQPAHAAGVVGNGTPGSCTEAALTTALLGGGTVTFNCGGPATILVLSKKVITQDTVIQGGGVITITGGLATRLFQVSDFVSLTLSDITLDSAHSPEGSGGAIYSTGMLTLNGVTIQNSLASEFGCGGAILTYGRTTIANSRFINNTAGDGGALCTQASQSLDVQITNSSFGRNRAIASGGKGSAIYHIAATLAVTGGAFYQNSATESGGAIYSLGSLNLSQVQFHSNAVPEGALSGGYGGGVASLGRLSLYDSAFAFNRGSWGGGLFVGDETGTARAELQGTTFDYNTAGLYGGGLYTGFSTTVITVTNSTFVHNTAGAGGGLARSDAQLQLLNSSFFANSASIGGGLYTGPGLAYVQVRSVTFTDNIANGNRGGGVYNDGRVELYFTSIVSNTNGVYSVSNGNTRFRSSVVHNPGTLNCDGDGTAQISNDAANHISDNSCGPQFTNKGDPQLGPLQIDRVGSYLNFYRPPLTGSPLINAGYSNCPERDQRGALRPDACDIGAVEFGGLLPRIYLPLLIR